VKQFVFHSSKNATNEVVKETISFTGNEEDQKKIKIQKYCVKVSENINSTQTEDYLNAIISAPDENLMIKQSVTYIDALWDKYKFKIFLFSLMHLI